MARQLYEKVHEEWKDRPDKTTPVLAADLEHIEQGIYNNSANMALKERYEDLYINLGNGNNVGNAGNCAFLGSGNKAETGSGNFQVVGDSNSIAGVYHGCFGPQNKLSGTTNFISGFSNTAEEGFGSVFGVGNIARAYQHVTGKYNVDDAEHRYAEIVGNGSDTAHRSNAYTLDWEGNAMFSGDVTTESGASLNAIGSPENIDIDFSNYFN